MQHSRRSSPAETRQRLLAAAARVYGRAGLNGATTRAIADEAGVNEVTLFRHFQTKDRLLAAVVGENFVTQPGRKQPSLPMATDDLRGDLLTLARRFETLFAENLPLLRTMLGEIQHFGRENQKHVFQGVFRPLKEALVARLQIAQRAGQLRTEPAAALLADMLSAILFMGVLRRSMSDVRLGYSATAHLEAAVDLVLHGAAPDGLQP